MFPKNIKKIYVRLQFRFIVGICKKILKMSLTYCHLIAETINMKVIVVSGAHSNIGKTQLARALCALFPGAVRIKIGHGMLKSDEDGYFYHQGTDFTTIVSEHSNADLLIIESNSILGEITPECVIYLPDDNPKPSAGLAEKKADIIRGKKVQDLKISDIAKRMKCDEKIIRSVVRLSGALEE
jgi:hypothetical protein